LDKTFLRLAMNEIDATELEFFHQPDPEVLKEAKRSLKALGAMDEDGSVTEIGRQILKLPISVNTARMVVEAMKNGCLDDVLMITACMEQKSIRHKSGAWKPLTEEKEADVLAELDVFKACLERRLNQDLVDNFRNRDIFAVNGVFKKGYFKAKETLQHLQDAVRRSGIDFRENNKNKGDREVILKSVLAGMVDHLYQKSKYGNSYINGDLVNRNLDNKSVVQGDPEWVVGLRLSTYNEEGLNYLTEKLQGAGSFEAVAQMDYSEDMKAVRIQELILEFKEFKTVEKT